MAQNHSEIPTHRLKTAVRQVVLCFGFDPVHDRVLYFSMRNSFLVKSIPLTTEITSVQAGLNPYTVKISGQRRVKLSRAKVIRG